MLLRIEDLPLHAIPSEPVTPQLVFKQFAVFAICHAVYVFDYERLGPDDAENPVKLLVQIVNGVARIASAALSKALAWIATDNQVRGWKCVEVRYIAVGDHRADIVFICPARSLADIVCPDDLVAESPESVIRTTTSTEKRYCAHLIHRPRTVNKMHGLHDN
jgi:hypothetical protein